MKQIATPLVRSANAGAKKTYASVTSVTKGNDPREDHALSSEAGGDKSNDDTTAEDHQDSAWVKAMSDLQYAVRSSVKLPKQMLANKKNSRVSALM